MQNHAKKPALLLGGGAIGAVNGLFGGGGGMVAVPLLERAAKLDSLSAHATAIAVVLPATLLSAVVYIIFGLVPLSVALPAAIGVSIGGYLGAKLLPFLPVRLVDFLFGIFMLAAGVRMLF